MERAGAGIGAGAEFANATGGFHVGNDMSLRDIEGENPLYLPQAKVYNACCALGPVVTLADAMPAHDEIGIRLAIKRDGKSVFEGSTTRQMARPFEELIGYLRATTVSRKA